MVLKSFVDWHLRREYKSLVEIRYQTLKLLKIELIVKSLELRLLNLSEINLLIRVYGQFEFFHKTKICDF